MSTKDAPMKRVSYRRQSSAGTPDAIKAGTASPLSKVLEGRNYDAGTGGTHGEHDSIGLTTAVAAHAYAISGYARKPVATA